MTMRVFVCVSWWIVIDDVVVIDVVEIVVVIFEVDNDGSGIGS